MATEEPIDISTRPKHYCFACGGNYYSLGSSSHYVGHRQGCPRSPQSKTERRIERPSKTVRWPEYGVYDRTGWYPKERTQRGRVTPSEVQY